MKVLRLLSSPVVLAFAVVVVGLVAGTGATEASPSHDYIGSERCKACHAEEYAAWQSSPHARALSGLSPSERTDPRCRACHTTVPSDTSPALEGVQCESCHGPGKHYAVDYVMRDLDLARALYLEKGDDKTCSRCHTESSPSLLPFDYAAKRKLIKHWADPAN
jgi:Cytochrome c554 and c-prime